MHKQAQNQKHCSSAHGAYTMCMSKALFPNYAVLQADTTSKVSSSLSEKDHPGILQSEHCNQCLRLTNLDLETSVLRSQKCQGYSCYSNTATSQTSCLWYLCLSCFECSSIKSKAHPFQKPATPHITWCLRKASLKTELSKHSLKYS